MFHASKVLIYLGVSLIALSQVIFAFVFYPAIINEINYYFQDSSSKQLTKTEELKLPLNNNEFKIIIPKVDIYSVIIPNVNPFKKEEYLEALTKGVAQAKGSALPGESGNIFIFAHSTNNPFIAQYNAFFYLINKLTAGDEIYLTYQNKNYKYIVENTKIINSSEVNYLNPETKKQTLTLMTCWPPGTTLKRLLVVSNLTE